jgi:hypothetical protein
MFLEKSKPLLYKHHIESRHKHKEHTTVLVLASKRNNYTWIPKDYPRPQHVERENSYSSKLFSWNSFIKELVLVFLPEWDKHKWRNLLIDKIVADYSTFGGFERSNPKTHIWKGEPGAMIEARFYPNGPVQILARRTNCSKLLTI